MCNNHGNSHFEGKSAKDHLIDAHKKGQAASAEIHGTEMSGSRSAFADSAKETAILLSLLVVILPLHQLAIILFGWVIWKGGRSSLLGWTKLERLHRVIAEEQYEITHHREQEREELTEIYRGKGFKEPMLKDVIDVLMADDNILMQVMIREELNLSLESDEHPLRQGFGALLGALLSGLLFLIALDFFGVIAAYIAAGLVIGTATFIAARLERSEEMTAVVWNLSLSAFAVGCSHLLFKFL